MNSIVAALAALALVAPARAQDGGVARVKEEPDYVKRLPFKPKVRAPALVGATLAPFHGHDHRIPWMCRGRAAARRRHHPRRLRCNVP